MAVKFGDVPKAPQYPFISGEDLADLERFTIIGVRRIPGRYGAQFYFDIAFKNEAGEVQRHCFTADVNGEREAMADLVIKNRNVVGVRLDIVATRGGNRYFKFADADAEKPLDTGTPGGNNELPDDDIPF
ncbi:MAG TPA: hypothetical protein VGO47_14700 [Chlamydiales bacterium]|jgi:hypothetical protein|nr:hypothetical protein [Chlamydiales bacterium]